LGFEIITANQYIRHEELGISLYIPEGLFKHSVSMIIHIYGMRTKNSFPQKYLDKLKDI